MTIPSIPEVGTAPSPAPSTQDTINFDARADAFHQFFPDWLNVKFPTVLQWIKDRAADVYAWASAADGSAAAAASSATAAQAASVAASTASNAPPWASGQTYAANAPAYSPITKSVYRRKTAGSGTPDPSEDKANWESLGIAVVNTDVGNEPNQLPRNLDLGAMAYMSPDAVVIKPVASATPAGLGEMVFQLTNDTTLVVKVKGRDGTVRTATLTLA